MLTVTVMDTVADLVDEALFLAVAVSVIVAVTLLLFFTEPVVVLVTIGVTDCVLLVLILTDCVELVDEVGLAVTQLDKLARVVELIEGLELGDTV